MWGKCGVGDKCDGCYLCAVSLGLAIGLTCGIFTVLFGWAGWMWGYGTSMIEMSATVHYGYAATFVGGLIGGLWAFVEGFIFGLVLGWIYNLIQYFCCKYCAKPEGDKK